MEIRSIRDLEYQCCFCGEGVDSSALDPCDMNILTNIDKAPDDRCDQTFWCHIVCFKDILHQRMKGHFVLDRPNPATIRYDEAVDRDYVINYLCCICDRHIESRNSDPCDINVMINFDKSKREQYNQTFYCHALCLKNTLHKDVQGYLVAALPD